MNESGYRVRNYHRSDFDNFVLLYREAEKQQPIGRPTSRRAIDERFGHPSYAPEQDIFVIEKDSTLVGYTDTIPERAIRRVVLYCWIHPDHRRKGLARQLLNCALDRAKQLDGQVLHVNISEDNDVARSVVERLGFHYVRRYLELRLDMEKMDWQGIEASALGCRPLKPGEESKLALIQNRAFDSHWGFNPNTIEEIVHDVTRLDHLPEDILVSADGEKLTAYCWTEVIRRGGVLMGQIYMIGTDPDYRGTGAGKKVLLAGLAHLRDKGVKFTELTVDSANKIACSLYDAMGFDIASSSLWFEKKVKPAGGEGQ